MAPAAKKDEEAKAATTQSDEQAVEEAGARRPTSQGDLAEVVRTVPNARTPDDDELKAEQERNDARKSDKLEEGDTLGSGIPPVNSAPDPDLPAPVSADADEEDQKKAVAAQSHSGQFAESDESSTVTLTGGDTVTVPVSQDAATQKLSGGGLVTFTDPESGDNIVVNGSEVSKVESA